VILLALLLASLGAADLVRSRGSGAIWAPGIVGTAVFVVGATGTGLDWWWNVVGAAAVFAWLLATEPFARGPIAVGASAGGATVARRSRAASDHTAYWAIRGLAITVLVIFVAAPALAAPAGWLARWYARLPYTALDDVSFTTFALAVGGVLFLFETANVIVRAALRGTGSDARPTDTSIPPAQAAAPPTRRWGRRAPDLVTAATEEPVPLKGGRFIGPLERVFLLALALSGEFTAIAAVVAAKGIIRFPEISKDDTAGSKAEYFLVGSFASWGLVLVVAVVLRFTSVN
jgi:hypothetical protein